MSGEVLGLSPRQAETLLAIRSHELAEGRPPTLDWVAGIMGLSRTTAHGHFAALTRKGCLTESQRRGRRGPRYTTPKARRWCRDRDPGRALELAWESADEDTRREFLERVGGDACTT